LDTIICASRMRGEGWGVGDGPVENEGQIRWPASIGPTGDTLSAHIASLGETWYERLVKLPSECYQVCHRQSRTEWTR
jgi:hypothetical protein